MGGQLTDLPRNWLMANLEMGRAHELKAWVLEAVEWGFDQPEGLTNNGKRARWLIECRDKTWTTLSQGVKAQPPGKAQPVVEKPKRTPRPKPSRPKITSEPFITESVDVFSPKQSRVREAKTAPRKVEPDLCEITASEANDLLRTTPARPHTETKQ